MNTLVRDQFIVGIVNPELQLKILEIDEPKLTFEEAIRFAQKQYSQIQRTNLKSEGSAFNDERESHQQQHDTSSVEKENPLITVKKYSRSKTHKPDPNKIYGCHFCSSGFRHERNLFRHYKNSHGDETIERRIVCNEVNCNQVFFSTRGWKRHRSLMHDYNSDDNWENVDIVDEKNASEVGVQTENHSKVSKPTVQGETKAKASRQKRFTCKYCKARFKHERNLIKHYKISNMII